MNTLIKKSTDKTNLLAAQKQKGNTMAAFAVGMALMAGATAVILVEGTELFGESDQLRATNEITSILNDYNTIRTANPTIAITAAQVPALTGANVYGIAANLWADPVFSYEVGDAGVCQELLASFSIHARVDGVNSGCAAGTNNNSLLNLTLN